MKFRNVGEHSDKRHAFRFVSFEILFDFVHFVKWNLRLFRFSPSLFPSSSFDNSFLAPSRIHLSLFNFVRRVSVAASRVTCHPDLVVYHWCHRVAVAKRIRALRCVSFLRGGEFREGRFAKYTNVALVKLNGCYISFFATSSSLVSSSRLEY